MTPDDRIIAQVEARLAGVEAVLPQTPSWHTSDEERSDGRLRVVAGPTVRAPTADQMATRTGRWRMWLSLAAAVGVISVVLWTGGFRPGIGLAPGASSPPAVSPSADPSASPVPSPSEPPASPLGGELRPLIEPRLHVPLASSGWLLVEDGQTWFVATHLLQDTGAVGFNVTTTILEPHGVYDVVNENLRLDLPTDLIQWIGEHPDLEAGPPQQVEVGGRGATAIDVTVTYEAGPKGQTAQFIDMGSGSWNLEPPSRKRIVLVEMDDRPLLIVYEARPELFDSAIDRFEQLLDSIEIEEAPLPS